MLTRALIVMLVVLNLGVAAWWWWRPALPPNADDAPRASGIARLQLLQERGELAGHASPSAADATTSATAATKPLAANPLTANTAGADQAGTDQATANQPNADIAAAERCYRFGPFADEAALTAARNVLQPRALRLREQTAPAARGRGWRVAIGPLADRAEANALAERIKQAGFGDLFVTGQGTEPAAIALGQFSNEDRAQRHATNLRDAGFAARAEPLGGTEPAARWLLVAAAAGFDAAAARRASAAAQAGATDCAALP
jgi:hypothetical protein